MATDNLEIEQRPRDESAELTSPRIALTVGASAAAEIFAHQYRLKLRVLDDVSDLLVPPAEFPALVIIDTEDSIGWITASFDSLQDAVGVGTPVVVVSAAPRRWELRAALAAGVAGVVLEGEREQALGPCLQAVLAGQVCVPRRNAEQIEPASLSAREKQILGLVVLGYMNSEIAEQLFVAVSTVKSHLSSAFAKLGVRSRSEAVDLIVDPERGLGMGILALGGEPLQPGEAVT